MLSYLDYAAFKKNADANGDGHWDCSTLAARWDYHQKAIDVIRILKIDNPSRVLEMGTMGASLVSCSHTIDFAERWDFQGKNPTYLHDARRIPWPISDKQYELFVALRVFQHLAPCQKACFREAKRISKCIILVVPDTYEHSELVSSRGIKYEDLLAWNGGVAPNVVQATRYGTLYFWGDTPRLAYAWLTLKWQMEKQNNTLAQYARRLWRIGSTKGKKIIGSTLKGMGLELRRVPDRKKNAEVVSRVNSHLRAHSGRTGQSVELIGPPGVGKTTLIDHMAQDAINRTWVTSQEVMGCLGDREPVPETFSDYEVLLGLKLEATLKYDFKVTNKDKYSLLAFFRSVADQDIRVRQSGAFTVVDDGLLQNYSNEMGRLYHENRDVFLRLVQNRSVVYMRASEKTVHERIIHRKAAGQLIRIHRGCNDDDLIQFTKRVLEDMTTFVEILEQAHVPVLFLDAWKAPEEYTNQVLEFINGLAHYRCK